MVKYVFTDSTLFNRVFKQGYKMDTTKMRIYHYKQSLVINFME